jgi:hypothetical protein
MARMGHDSIRAAIIYQHATTEADAKIAAALDAESSAEQVPPGGTDSLQTTMTTREPPASS